MPKQKDEFSCLLSMPDLGKYVGKWIVVVGNRLVASGTVTKEVFAEAKPSIRKANPYF